MGVSRKTPREVSPSVRRAFLDWAKSGVIASLYPCREYDTQRPLGVLLLLLLLMLLFVPCVVVMLSFLVAERL